VSFWLFAFFSYSRYCVSALISSIFFELLECYLFLEYEMHISAMLKFLGLSCDIILYLFSQVLFTTAVILPNFCYPNKNIFGIFFFGKFLLDLLQKHVCWQSTPQGPLEACGR
jgi:hypothetical protein